MTIGAFTDLLTFQRLTRTRDATGGSIETWADAFSVWARPLSLSEQEQYFSGVEAGVTVYDAELRWHPDLEDVAAAPSAYRVVRAGTTLPILRWGQRPDGSHVVRARRV